MQDAAPRPEIGGEDDDAERIVEEDRDGPADDAEFGDGSPAEDQRGRERDEGERARAHDRGRRSMLPVPRITAASALNSHTRTAPAKITSE